MKRRAILLLALLLYVATASWAGSRERIDINRGWQFYLGKLSDMSEVKDYAHTIVHLPHDFLIGQPWVEPEASEQPDLSDAGSNVRSRLSARGFKEMNTGWYRYTFTPNESWRERRVVLNFEGIMLVGDVWLNGSHIGGTDYGYLGFEIDITQLLRYGQENEIVVKADTGDPQNSRWYTGGGLYRNVELIITDKNLFFPRHPLYITTKNNCCVDITAEILCKSNQKEIPIRVRIIDADGQIVAEHHENLAFNARWRQREYKLESIILQEPRLWSCELPHLYTAELTIYDAQGKITDSISEKFGVREIEFGADFGFKLNGEKVLLKGFANHHTLGALGAAAYPRAIEKRLKMMKDFGFNHVRTSHNPYSVDFLHLCDSLGILVVDELYDKWLTQYAGGRREWIELWQRDIPECR